VLEIKPVDELEEPNSPSTSDRETIGDEPVTIEQDDIFKRKNLKRNIILKVDDSDVESIISEESITNDDEPVHVTRGVGKRGKDKKKRVTKPCSDKQRANLAKARVKAKEKRDAKRLAKEKEKAEIQAIKEERRARKITNKKITKSKPIDIPKKPVPPANHNPMEMHKFFQMMQRYEEYKDHKKAQKEKKTQPHPNKNIPKKQRPKPPAYAQQALKELNPFDVCFNY